MPQMKPAFSVLLCVFAALHQAVNAGGVFRCEENGKTIFTEQATGASCQPMELKVIEPDSQEADRQRLETELWKERREMEAQRSLDRDARARQSLRAAEIEAVSRVPRANGARAWRKERRRWRNTKGAGTGEAFP